MSEVARVLPFARVPNARDVGGYATPHGPLAWRRLLRSSKLDLLDDVDRELLATIGLRTVVDLRSDVERDTWPSNLGDLRVDVVHMPIVPGSTRVQLEERPPLEVIYEQMIEEGATAIAQAINVLALPGALPALVHCTGGKDRTGIVIAFALTMVGVDRASVLEDYAVSAGLLGADFARQVSSLFGGDVRRSGGRAVLTSPAELLAATLERIEAGHGSVEGYLQLHGLEPGAPARLRSALLAT